MPAPPASWWYGHALHVRFAAHGRRPTSIPAARRSCSKCNEVAFCAACWADHPGRQTALDDIPETEKVEHPFGSVEHVRENLVIRPLEWAYDSKALKDVPVEYKGGMRRLLYHHKRLAAQAAAAVAEEPGPSG